MALCVGISIVWTVVLIFCRAETGYRTKLTTMFRPNCRVTVLDTDQRVQAIPGHMEGEKTEERKRS